jgi:hypothetical protein
MSTALAPCAHRFPTRTVDGFGKVLPQPYHIPATHSPRRNGPTTAALNSAEAFRAACHQQQRLKQARMPAGTPACRRPIVSAFRMRNSAIHSTRSAIRLQLLLRNRGLGHAESAKRTCWNDVRMHCHVSAVVGTD